MSRLPLIGVTACAKQTGLHPYHIADDKYLRAVANGVGDLPLIILALGEPIDQAALLDSIDGLLFIGLPSNAEPRHYSRLANELGTLHDSDRDATTLPLVRVVINADIPVLGIRRGFQEMNVVFGDSLHQKVHEVGTFMDHREPVDQPLEIQYAPRHVMHAQPGGVLAGIGLPNEPRVNSIHGQGVGRLAPGPRVEALVPNGLVGAIFVEGVEASALGVQWYPEWQVLTNPNYLAVFQAFGKACGKRTGQRWVRLLGPDSQP